MGRPHLIAIGEETHSIAEWCLKLGIRRRTYEERVRSGWTDVTALTTPVGQAPETITAPLSQQLRELANDLHGLELRLAEIDRQIVHVQRQVRLRLQRQRLHRRKA